MENLKRIDMSLSNNSLILKKAECLNDQTKIDVTDNTSAPFDDVQNANNTPVLMKYVLTTSK